MSNPTQFIESVVQAVGVKGFPTCLDEKYKGSWDLYKHRDSATARDRLLHVLNFIHILSKAGLKVSSLKVPGFEHFNPVAIYKHLVSLEIKQDAEALTKQLRTCRVFDVFKIYKSLVKLHRGFRGSNKLNLNICVEPRRKEHLDGALVKAEGFLYHGELPLQLRESWGKLPINSKRKPKSALPKSSDLIAAESTIGRLPLYVDGARSLTVCRASDGLLVFRFSVTRQIDPTPWMTRHQHDMLVVALFKKAFSTI